MTILYIETSGVNCSVAVSRGEELLAEQSENTGKFTHSEHLHTFIEKVLPQAGVSLGDLDAIAVSGGAGSYTGLRIGVATAKGLCFALGKPLIAIPTLQILASQVQGRCIIPMIDARRMEVYSAVLNDRYEFVSPSEAKILDADSYSEYLNEGKVIFLGDGAKKFSAICTHPNAVFVENAFPQARDMVRFATERYQRGDFADVAYFEPQYLK